MRLRARRIQTLILALATGLLLAQAAAARPPHHGRHGPPGGMVAQHAQELGLEPEVQEAIQAIADASGERDRALREEIHEGHGAMRELLSSEEPNGDAVMAQADALSALEAESRRNRIQATMEIRALLTPEQREQLMAMRETRREERKERKRRFGPLGRCSGDLHELCGDAEPGLPSFTCLGERWSEVSPECQDAFDANAPSGHPWKRGKDEPLDR